MAQRKSILRKEPLEQQRISYFFSLYIKLEWINSFILLVSLFEPEEKKGNFWYPIQNILHHCSLERTMNRRGAEEGKNGVIIIIPSHLLKLFSLTKKKNSKPSSSPTNQTDQKKQPLFFIFSSWTMPVNYWKSRIISNSYPKSLSLLEYNEDS